MATNDTSNPQEIQDRIRELAYSMWERAGRLPDMAHEYWVAAEKEVLATLRTAAEKLIPGERPEKAEEPKAKPTPLETPKPVGAAAKPKAKATKAEDRKAEERKAEERKAEERKAETGKPE